MGNAWWARRSRRWFAVALASSLVAVQVVAGAAAPAGAATPKITLVPQAVVGGEPITVTGSGFASDESIALVECDYVGEIPDDFSYCDYPGGGAIADENGAFTGTITPVGSFTAPSSGIDVNCSLGCTIVAVDSDTSHMLAGASFTFAPPPHPPTISSERGFVPEGNAGLTPLDILVTLDPASTETVTVPYTTKFTPGAPTPRQADPATDYIPVRGTLTFAPGETQKHITIMIKTDVEIEGFESIIVYFSNPTNALLDSHYAVGTIEDDEGYVYGRGASALEGDSGTTTIMVPVDVDAILSEPMTLDWRATSVSGHPPFADPVDDFVPASGTVTFAPHQQTAYVPVTVKGDTTVEHHEWIVVAFSNPSHGRMAGNYKGLGFALIINDDVNPP